MKNKRGQFYIIGAILIVVVLTGITSLSTYAITKSKPRTIESMGKELKEEGYRIIDYAIIQNEEPYLDLETFLTDKYPDYFLKKTDNTSIIFVYGDKTNLYATKYDTVSVGSVRASITSPAPTWGMVTSVVYKTPLDSSSGAVKIELLGETYNINLNNNEMFYFIIMQEKEGERYIEKDV
jgi:hypothetical protein